MRKLILMSVCLVCGVWSASAQSTTQKMELNLDQAITIALSDNPTIKVANMEVERQTYVRKETTGSLLPQLSATGSYNYNIMNPVMFMPENIFGPGSGGAMRMGFSNSFVGGVSLSIPLYMPTLYKTLQLNEKQMMQALESARSSKITLANQVKKSYYGVLLGQSSLAVIKTNIEYAKIVVENTRNFYKQGSASEYDLITAEVQLSNLNPVLLTAENGLRVSRLMLNMLLSLPLDTYVEPVETLESFSQFASKDSALMVDVSGNADLSLLAIQGEILQKQLEIQKATRIPTLNAVAQYQVQSQNNTLNIGTYDWRGTALAGLQLSVPIFSGNSKINKERQIQNNIGQIEEQLRYMNQSVTVEAQTALSNLKASRASMQANQQAKIQAAKGYTISKTRYTTGMGTIVELNSSQMALLQSELNFTQSIYDYMSALADFDKVIGKNELSK